MNQWIRIAGVFLLVLGSGCNSGTLYDRIESVDPTGWQVEDRVIFSVPVQDTVGMYNLYLQIRNESGYAYSNLWLFIDTYAPTGASLRDTLECKLANEMGKWYGRGVGNKFAVEMPYRTGVRFPYPGTYRIEVQQGMREEALKAIHDIGLRIEKVD